MFNFNRNVPPPTYMGRTMFNQVTVRETPTEIVISGVHAHDIIRDINKHWKTTRITNQMFNTITKSSLSFFTFFAPEVMYMLENIKHYRNRYTSIKAINAIREAMMENTWLKGTKPVDRATVKGRLDFKRLNNMTFEAKDYQMEYFEDYNYRLDQYGLMGDLMSAAAGSGKTFGMSALAEMLNGEFIVIFCPKIAVDTVWVPSLKEMFKAPQTIWDSLSGKPYKGERWLVCHYDRMDLVADIVRNTENWNKKKVVTILDESHNLNDPNSLRSINYQSITKILGSENNIQGSGTAVKALGVELINLLRTIDRRFTPAVEVRFKKMYGKEASKGLDIIRHRLGLSSFTIEKKDIGNELLPPIMKTYPVKIPNSEQFTLPAIQKVMEAYIKERVEYYKARRSQDEAFWDKCVMLARKAILTKDERVAFDEYLYMVHLIAKTPDPRYLGDEMKRCNAYEKKTFERYLPREMIPQFRDVKSVIKYTKLKIQGETLGNIVGGLRIAAHVAMVPYIDWVGIIESTEKKTIVFTSFVEALEAAVTTVTKIGMKPLTVYGKNTNDLANTIKLFDTRKELNPLIATYASLSTAVRLTIADTMIMINAPFRSYILEQAVSRIYRLGQDSQPYVYQCVLDTGEVPNISTRSADILAWSTAMVEAILGVKSPLEVTDTYVAMEAVDPEGKIFDDNKLYYMILNNAFEQYGITIDDSQFKIPVEKVQKIPAYLR